MWAGLRVQVGSREVRLGGPRDGSGVEGREVWRHGGWTQGQSAVLGTWTVLPGCRLFREWAGAREGLAAGVRPKLL